MMWPPGLPSLLITTMPPWLPGAVNRWEASLAKMASMATRMLPSVPFLKPTGQGRAEASCLCTWDSVVRAPIAPQLMRSAR
ncbi:hypothetical protein D3C80_1804450 [compost metagenome]